MGRQKAFLLLIVSAAPVACSLSPVIGDQLPARSPKWRTDRKQVPGLGNGTSLSIPILTLIPYFDSYPDHRTMLTLICSPLILILIFSFDPHLDPHLILASRSSTAEKMIFTLILPLVSPESSLWFSLSILTLMVTLFTGPTLILPWSSH